MGQLAPCLHPNPKSSAAGLCPRHPPRDVHVLARPLRAAATLLVFPNRGLTGMFTHQEPEGPCSNFMCSQVSSRTKGHPPTQLHPPFPESEGLRGARPVWRKPQGPTESRGASCDDAHRPLLQALPLPGAGQLLLGSAPPGQAPSSGVHALGTHPSSRPHPRIGLGLQGGLCWLPVAPASEAGAAPREGPEHPGGPCHLHPHVSTAFLRTVIPGSIVSPHSSS